MINGVGINVKLFNDILDEQTTIAILSKGAIPISDTNNMPPSDRRRILNNLIEIENKKQEAINNIKSKK